MSNKVKCGTCVNEINSYCGIKKSKVKPNKNRNCEYFELDVSKVKTKQILEFVRRPDYFWDDQLKKELRRKERKKLEEEVNKQLEQAKQDRKQNEEDVKHPLTGDLSRFKTTASKGE